jgi:hypothetical protein
LLRCGGRKDHGPVRRVERWKQWETGVDQRLAGSDEKLSTIGNYRAHPDQLFVVTAGNFEHGKALDPPSLVTFVDRSKQQVVI